MDFHEWVNAFGGATKLAKALGVVPHTVRKWLRRAGWPNTETIIEMIRLSGGVLTFEKIIEGTSPKRRNRKAG